MRLFSGNADRVLEALGRSLAVIEFTPNGEILSANANFCSVLGYERREIVGQHHRMFVEPQFASSAEYRDFWTALAAGSPVADVFKRLAKGGREVWIRATYNPVLDSRGGSRRSSSSRPTSRRRSGSPWRMPRSWLRCRARRQSSSSRRMGRS